MSNFYRYLILASLPLLLVLSACSDKKQPTAPATQEKKAQTYEDFLAEQARQQGVTPLMVIAYRGDLDAMKKMLGAGADVNARGRGGTTALIMAAEQGKTEVVEELLKSGADPNAETEEGVTALLTAAFRGDLGIVQALIKHKANVNAIKTPHKPKTPPLVAAAGGGHEKIIKALLDAGADINAGDEQGVTALIDAAHGNVRMVKFLLENGADTKARAMDNRTAMAVAEQNGQKEIVRLLKAASGKKSSPKPAKQ